MRGASALIRLAANISTMFTEWPLLDRPRQAALCGFEAIEVQFLADLPQAQALGAAARDVGVNVALVNAPCGVIASGELGLAGLVSGGARFSDSVAEGVAMAKALGASALHVLAGRRQPEVALEAQHAQLAASFALAAAAADQEGLKVLTEPLNARLAPDYLISSLDNAHALLDAVDHPGLAIQFDLFHLQIMGGDILSRFAESRPRVGHVQIAAVPSRKEPDEGELDYDRVLQGLVGDGYAGWIGCEYIPRAGTHAGLAWAHRYGIKAP